MSYSLPITAVLCLVAAAVVCEGAEPARNQSPLDRYNVVWETPSRDHNGSMPIGNGETGLNVWVEPGGDLVFLISRTDSWDENERLCKLGRVRITFTPPLTGGDFRQTLRLHEGQITIVGGAGEKAVRVRIWVDAHRQVAYVEADSGKDFHMRVALETWRNAKREIRGKEAHGVNGFRGAKIVHPDTVLGGRKDRIVWYHRNPVSPWKGTLELQHLQDAIKIGTDPLLHRTFGGVIRGQGLLGEDDKTLKSAKPGKRFAVSVHTETLSPATEAQWLAAVEKNIAEADRAGLDKARTAHRRWWSDFWNRSWVRVTGNKAAEAISRAYVLQRWINACGGRGRFPIKFNGTIFTVNTRFDPDYRQWGGCYWFQNTRLPYWPMLAAGDYDLMRPLFRMFLDAIPLAKIRTKVYFGHEGVFFPETMSFWGTYDNGGHGWGWRTGQKPGTPVANSYIRFHYSGTPELLAMMIDYYAHTRDAEFLKTELLPIADEYLLWWDKHWPRGPKGKLKMHPSYACETYCNVTNPTPDVAGLIWDLDGLLRLSDAEIGAARRARWSKFRGQIPAIPMRSAKGKQVIAPAEGQIPRRHNSENPELYAIFPFRIYGVGKDGLDLARDTFAARTVKGNNGWRQDDTQAAFLGLAKTAADYVAGRARNKHKPSRFPAFWGPNFDWIPDQDHGGNLLMALQAMVLQADPPSPKGSGVASGGKIRVLPAWPKDWDLDFKLCAPGKTTVEGKVRDGKLADVKVSPESRKKDLVVMQPQ